MVTLVWSELFSINNLNFVYNIRNEEKEDERIQLRKVNHLTKNRILFTVWKRAVKKQCLVEVVGWHPDEASEES